MSGPDGFKRVAPYLLAVAAAAAAIAARGLVDPWLGTELAFVTVFPVVAAVVWVGGYRPAILTALLGYLGCAWLFIAPRGAFGLTRAANIVGLVAFAFAMAVVIWLGESTRRAEARARQAEGERGSASEIRARLAAVVDSSDDAIVTKTLEGRILTWNAGAQRLFGYTPEEAIGQSIELIIPPEYRAQEREILSRLRRGQRVEHFETVRVTKDGRRLDISLTVSPLRDEHGRVVGASKVARDITERRRAEEALREADRRKDEFLATLSHELRNPLAPIRTAVGMLGMPGAGEKERTWAMRVIERQVQQMVRLLDDLLDISRIAHNKLMLQRERVELTAVVDAAIETSRPFLDSGRHQLTVRLPDAPVHVDADRVRLAQVFANLITNAAKYTDPGGHIRLEADREGRDVVLRVVDDGIGMTPDVLGRVFDMFTQDPDAARRSQGGLGIGLALVRALVELHGGSIVASSEGPGRGSTFSVTLPVADAPGEDRVEPREAVAGARAPRPRRVLIVDDAQDGAESLAAVLRIRGHEVRTAYDGEQAMALAEAFRPEMACVDIGMPKVNGHETCRRMRERPWGRNILLIAVTGWGQDRDRERSKAAGFDEHLVKPVDPARVIEMLESLD